MIRAHGVEHGDVIRYFAIAETHEQDEWRLGRIEGGPYESEGRQWWDVRDMDGALRLVPATALRPAHPLEALSVEAPS